MECRSVGAFRNPSLQYSTTPTLHFLVFASSTIQFGVGARVSAGADAGIERYAARPPLYHEVDGTKALEQGNRQLDAGERAPVISADGELIAPQPSRQTASHAEPARGYASLNRRQLVFTARVAFIVS